MSSTNGENQGVTVQPPDEQVVNRVAEQFRETGLYSILGIGVQELLELLEDLRAHRMGIYWADFLFSVSCGYAAFAIFPARWPISVFSLGCFVVATCCLYRAVFFVHELAHMPKGKFRAFRLAWNILCGVPLLFPSFLFEMHSEHHAQRTYGSVYDREYLSFANAHRTRAVWFILALVIQAPLFVVRFLLLAPIGWLVPRLRLIILSHAFALVIDGEYGRRLPPRRIPRHWTLQEAGCCLWCLVITGLLITGALSGWRIVEAYAVVTAIMLINFLRVLAAHHYRGTGVPMSFAQQVIDTNDFPNGLLAEVWAPVGSRYHAIHHLVPNLSYHSLPEAHRRLISYIPQESPFRRTSRRSFVSALYDLLVARPAYGGNRK